MRWRIAALSGSPARTSPGGGSSPASHRARVPPRPAAPPRAAPGCRALSSPPIPTARHAPADRHTCRRAPRAAPPGGRNAPPPRPRRRPNRHRTPAATHGNRAMMSQARSIALSSICASAWSQRDPAVKRAEITPWRGISFGCSSDGRGGRAGRGGGVAAPISKLPPRHRSQSARLELDFFGGISGGENFDRTSGQAGPLTRPIASRQAPPSPRRRG